MKKLAQALIVFTVMVGGFLAPLHVSVEKQTALTANSYSIDVGINHADAFNPALWLFGLDSDSIANGVQAALLSFWKVIIFDFTQMLAGFAGWFMDFFLQYSIDANTYRTGIIEAGWEIIRNMVNIVFIFSLLTIAFQKVLGSSGAGLNRRLMKTILVALAVNFSLFASFLVIDASNILTTVIYNQIEVVGELDSKSRVKETSWVEDLFRDSETKSISIAVTSKFNPQKLALFKTADGTPLNLGQRFFLYTIAGLLNILLISVFLSVSFVFLTRTIVLMFIGILAPLAFASITLPGMEKLKYVGFNDWQKQLINLSFTAPVFVFFLYLIVVFATDKSFMGSVSFTNETGNFIATIMQVLLPFALIATLLKTAEIVTKSMVVGIGGKVSEMVSKTVGTATGAVAQVGIAAATGGASFGVTAIKGAVAKKGFGQTVKSAASSGLRTFRNTKFDISKYPGFKDAKSFGSVRDVQLMGKKKYSDLRYGTSKNEFEYQKEKEKINDQSEKWQDGINDQKDKKDIKKEKDKLMNETKPGTSKSYKDAIISALEEHSKGQVVEANQSVSYNLGGSTVNMQVKNASKEDISRIDFEKSVIKKQEKEKKQYEEIIKNKRAENDTTGVATAQTTLDNHEKIMQDFKKQTLEGMKEQAKKEEMKITSRAKEHVAKKRDKQKESKRASRIRTGKVKVEDVKPEDGAK